LDDSQPSFTQLVSQRVFVHRFEKPSSKRIYNPKRAINDALRQPAAPDLIGVHRRSSVADIPRGVSFSDDLANRKAFTSASS
jgi:hypothetical protein